jgi:hypothetical protein
MWAFGARELYRLSEHIMRINITVKSVVGGDTEQPLPAQRT